MNLEKLRINELRNIENMDLRPCPDINGIYGENGAGKTAVLESIYILARGKTFRGTELFPLTRKGAVKTTVFGLIKNNTIEKRIGVEIRNRKKTIQVNGVGKYTASDLAKEVRIVVVTPNHVDGLIMSEAIRRKFLDWGVFHVEQNYQETYRQFIKILKQRNSVLSKQNCTTVGWDQSLIDISNIIHDLRKEFLNKLLDYFPTELSRLGLGYLDVQLKYQRGWKEEKTLKSCLEERLNTDIKKGFTSVGPQRGGFTLFSNGQKLKYFCSSGQAKLVVSALYFALVKLIEDATGEKPILLYDEVESDLDKKNINKLFGAIIEMNIQVFMTALRKDFHPGIAEDRIKLFHVEQGVIVD